MKRLLICVLALTAAVFTTDYSVSPAQAQSYYDDDDYGPRRYRPRRYQDDGYGYRPYQYRRPRYYDDSYARPRRRVSDGCRALIRATGKGHLVPAISRNSAILAWRREAQAVYGRDFSWGAAKGTSITCSPYIATLRCTASGRPC